MSSLPFRADNQDIKLIHIAAQQTRLEILNALDRNSRMYASKLGQLLHGDRKIIAFHLNALEKVGLVNSEYGLSKEIGARPVAAKYYTLTPKGREIFERILHMLKPK